MYGDTKHNKYLKYLTVAIHTGLSGLKCLSQGSLKCLLNRVNLVKCFVTLVSCKIVPHFSVEDIAYILDLQVSYHVYKLALRMGLAFQCQANNPLNL